jgi:hypothetical protein
VAATQRRQAVRFAAQQQNECRNTMRRARLSAPSMPSRQGPKLVAAFSGAIFSVFSPWEAARDRDSVTPL